MKNPIRILHSAFIVLHFLYADARTGRRMVRREAAD